MKKKTPNNFEISELVKKGLDLTFKKSFKSKRQDCKINGAIKKFKASDITEYKVLRTTNKTS